MNRADVQGLLFSNYASHPASALLLLRFAEGRPHAWLRRILPLVSCGASWERYDSFRVNLAFTYRGLARLGLPAATLAGFSQEFQQGMARAERSRVSQGKSDPSTWDFTDEENRGVDATLLVYASNPAALENKLEELTSGLSRFGLEFELLRSHWPVDESARVAFHEGFAEPNVRGFGLSRGSSGPRIARGEFLLGYADEVGDRERGPSAPARRTTREPPPMAEGTNSVDLGFNGSYLVLWKLEQPVGVSRTDRSAPRVSPGRTRSRNIPQGDERGRRRQRIIGRSRLYREGAEGAEGLLFLALNADLSRQFESLRAEHASTGQGPEGSLGRVVRGGLYGFLPSLRALGYFADLDES